MTTPTQLIAGNNAAGAGGIVNITGGNGTTAGGDINITPGNNSGGADGAIHIIQTADGPTELRFLDASGTPYVGFKAPAVATINTVWSLPPADGTSGQVIQTNGAAALSFVNAASTANVSMTFTSHHDATECVISPAVAGQANWTGGNGYIGGTGFEDRVILPYAGTTGAKSFQFLTYNTGAALTITIYQFTHSLSLSPLEDKDTV